MLQQPDTHLYLAGVDPDVDAHREGACRHGRLGRPLAGDPREDEDRGPLERRAVLN